MGLILAFGTKLWTGMGLQLTVPPSRRQASHRGKFCLNKLVILLMKRQGGSKQTRRGQIANGVW